MAVYLSMNMSYVGQGDYTNTSKILVEVVATWNYPHYNRDGSTLLVTVGGEDHQTSVIFNPSELSSGTQKLYSYYWNISQPNGSATTVYGYASCQVTNSTAATPAYAELYLAAIGGTGGSTGGNPDGGSTGENPGGGSEGGSNPDSGGTPDVDDPDDDFDYEDYGDPKETVSETLGGITVTADIYYDSGPEVIVKVSRTDLPWRINGTKSGGDHGTYYISQNNDSVRSFNSYEDVHNYAFQICYSGSWSNGDVFTVNFGDDGSGDDDEGGGGYGDSSAPRVLQLEQGEGTSLYVQFWASSQYDQWEGFRGNEAAIIRYNGIDAIRVITEAQEGYELDYYDNDGLTLGYRLENLEYYMHDPVDPNTIYFRLASDGDAKIVSTAHRIGGDGDEYTNTLYFEQGEGTVLSAYFVNESHPQAFEDFNGTTSAIMRYNGVDEVFIKIEASDGYELEYYDHVVYYEYPDDYWVYQLPCIVENLECVGIGYSSAGYISGYYFKLKSNNDARIISTAHKTDDGGGGDSGDGNGGEPDLFPKDASYIYIQQGRGTKLTVTRTYVDRDSYLAAGDYIGELVDGTPIIDKNGETWYRHVGWNDDVFSIEAEALPGYTIKQYYYDSDLYDFEISEPSAMRYGLNYDGNYGWIFDTDSAFSPEDKSNQAWIRSKATPNVPTVKIDTDGSGFNPYVCYIETEINPQTTTECEIIGQAGVFGYLNTGDWEISGAPSLYTTNYWGALGSDKSWLYRLMFVTPDFIGKSTSIKFKIKTTGKMFDGNNSLPLMNYALCGLASNFSKYALTFDVPEDEYRITSGTFNEVIGTNVIEINNITLNPNTEYQLLIWDAQGGEPTVVSSAENHSVIFTLEDTNNTILEFLPYSIYINNGESWELL